MKKHIKSFKKQNKIIYNMDKNTISRQDLRKVRKIKLSYYSSTSKMSVSIKYY